MNSGRSETLQVRPDRQYLLKGIVRCAYCGMPMWAQTFTKFNPVSYFIEVMRMVVLKGSTLYDIRFHLLKVLIFGIVLNGLAVWNYRKRN